MVSNVCAGCRSGSAVGQKVLLDIVAVGLEQHVGAAQLADLLLGPLDHAVALAGLLVFHLSGRRDFEALLGARFGLDLGHLALLYRSGPTPKGRVRPVMASIKRAG